MKTKLSDGTQVHCLRKPEAKMLDHHVEGYLQHGIEIHDNDIVFDIGANIGVFGVRVMQKAKNVSVYCLEPIPEILEVLSANATLHGHGKMHVLPFGVSSENTTATFTYFPNTPALSTLHPEQWDVDPRAFEKAVKGTMKSPPANMWWMRLIPRFFAGTIAKQLIKGKRTVNCELRTLSSLMEQENISKIDLCREIQSLIPTFTFLEAALGKDPDQRNYVVSNQKIENLGFKPAVSLRNGLEELIKGLKMFNHKPFTNV